MSVAARQARPSLEGFDPWWLPRAVWIWLSQSFPGRHSNSYSPSECEIFPTFRKRKGGWGGKWFGCRRWHLVSQARETQQRHNKAISTHRRLGLRKKRRERDALLRGQNHLPHYWLGVCLLSSSQDALVRACLGQRRQKKGLLNKRPVTDTHGLFVSSSQG